MPYGVFLNCGTVLAGGLLGAVIRERFPQRLKEALPMVFALSAMTIGISLIINLHSLSAVILSMILGTMIGELLGLETHLIEGLKKLEHRLPGNMSEKQMDILVSLIVLFCFSGTGIFGAMNSAMTGDHSILYVKAMMDFFTAIIFGTTAGYLVGMVSIPQLAIGCLLFYGASYIMPLVNDVMLANFKAVGGVITLAVGFKIAEMKHMRVLNMLPAIALAFPLSIIC